MPAPAATEPVRLTRLWAEDAPLVASLHAQCFDKPWSAQGFRDMAETPACSGFLAWRDDRLAGFLLATIAGAEAEILTLAVAPDLRRRGIGALLLARLMEEAAARGAEAVFLEVGAANRAALRLYNRFGFREVGGRKSYYKSDRGAQDALIMRFDLPPSG